ncbi:DHA2 family efflux MFS transporter permease subunit [Microbacterium phyllosphaerae]|uniref:DHA2 family efflux MFS transporter permease subunit n=1 Tax=Microbacterium phyllosphaerae TaxID=124798 RepID=UPI000EA39D91|nr:DHA2 family efflux MFS transporter permease subunit [Microbacterium phyllosphaerae]
MTAHYRRTPVWLAIVAASLPMFMATLDNLVVTGALPVISRELDASMEELQWVINAYTLSFATFMLLAVGLGDRFGRRTVFLGGIAVFTLASAAAALATDPGLLILARAVQGVGAAALMPLSLTLLVGTVSDRLRPAAIGIWGGISGLGVATGPLIGGAVIEGWNWQTIFWLNVPIGLIAVPLVLAALPNSFGARVRADLIGLLLAGPGVLGVVYGIVRGNDAGWDSLEVVGSLSAGALLLVAFVVWEGRTANPLLPLRLFRDRSFTVANLVGVTFSFGIFGAIFILIQFLQVVQGYTPLEAGIMTMPWTLAPMIVAPLTGMLSPRTGTRVPIMLGLSMLAVALGWIATTLSASLTYAEMWPPFLLAGIGMGLVFAPSSTAVLVNMRPEDHAKASGTNSTLREIGVALGVAVLTAVFTGAGGTLTPTGYVDAAVPAIWVGAGALALAAVIAVAMPSGIRRVRQIATRRVDVEEAIEPGVPLVPALTDESS